MNLAKKMFCVLLAVLMLGSLSALAVSDAPEEAVEAPAEEILEVPAEEIAEAPAEEPVEEPIEELLWIRYRLVHQGRSADHRGFRPAERLHRR